MSDDRRERYRLAVKRYAADYAYEIADAAMAVADEEQRNGRAQYESICAQADELAAENARLREEIGGTDGSLSWGMHADVAEAQSEIERLRGELIYAQTKREDHWREVLRLRAELERRTLMLGASRDQVSALKTDTGTLCTACGKPIHYPARTMGAGQTWEHVGHSDHAAIPPK